MNFLEVFNGSHDSWSEELASLRDIALMTVMQQGLVPVVPTQNLTFLLLRSRCFLLGGFFSSLLNLFH